jgi:hypothetical protein
MKKVIKDWEARRSGAAISISGTDAGSGEKVTITGIERIVPDGGTLAAIHADETHQLLV